MKKELSTAFDTRQYMQSDSLEIFYYNDCLLYTSEPCHIPSF